MLSRLRSRAQEEKGFTLIELLVVVLIIGILAAIAIPAFLSQKKGAQDSAAKSLLRNAAIGLEAYYTENQNFAAPGSTTAALANANLSAIEPNIAWNVVAAAPTGTSGAPLAKDDQVHVLVTATTFDGYTLYTRSTSGAGFVWNRSATGSTGKCKVADGTLSGACATDGSMKQF